MRKRRREEEREAEHPGKRQLAQLDTATRAGVFEELQRASGNRAVQEVLTGAQLQRDTVTAAPAGTVSTRRAYTADWVLSLDGTVVGAVQSVEGLSVKSEVVSTVGPGHEVTKHIGSTAYDPGVLKVGLGMSTGFSDWIGSVFEKKDARKELILHQVDRATGQERTQLELGRTLVTAVEVPQLATDQGEAWLKITIAPEWVRRRAGSGAKVDAKLASDPLDPSTMRFEVKGMGPVSGIKSVGPWGLRQGEKAIGRFGRLEPTKTDYDNLVVTLTDGAKGASAFDAWVEEAVVKGNAGKESERTAVLTVSSKGGRKLKLSFSGVGIFSAEQVARPEAGGRQYGLFVQGASLRIA
jgi:hypothetical protein